MAILVLLAASARAKIITASYSLNVNRTFLNRFTVCRDLVFINNGLTFLIRFDVSLHNISSYFFLNRSSHSIEHLKTFELILAKRIRTTVSTQVNPLTQLIHCINMIHPFAIYGTKHDYLLEFTHQF
ncbi:hypothetical protein D3C76_1271080 [compost metagenome]